jgi:hypothetical protein
MTHFVPHCPILYEIKKNTTTYIGIGNGALLCLRPSITGVELNLAVNSLVGERSMGGVEFSALCKDSDPSKVGGNRGDEG